MPVSLSERATSAHAATASADAPSVRKGARSTQATRSIVAGLPLVYAATWREKNSYFGSF